MTTSQVSLEALLMAAVQRLALPADDALSAHLLGNGNPDALALEFDDLYTDYVDQLDELPTEDQLVSLQSLDSALTSMSGAANVDLWTEASIRTHPRWAEVRDLARQVVGHFGW